MITRLSSIIAAFLMFAGGAHSLFAQSSSDIAIENVEVKQTGKEVRLTAEINLDDVRLGRNRQLYITPVIEGGEDRKVVLPSVLVSGHDMHIAYQRKTLPKKQISNHNIITAVKRENGKTQQVYYAVTTDMEKWMWGANTELKWMLDTCGCGVLAGSRMNGGVPLGLNPSAGMRTVYMTPSVTELPVAVHEGKAKVQFEVSRTDLHTSPYVCRSGQLIDNRKELQIIDDSIRYALSDKNVEIAKIKIIGYASPEGSYLGNDRLSTDRSRALSEYIAERYNLPADKVEYGAVAEDWKGFRDLVEASEELTLNQKNDLLQLIDRPAYGPADYDAKEQELRTSPRFSGIYKTIILPKIFPQLRATKFEISTRLRPMSDEALAEVILSSPEKMSLNQMFRVARLYTEGSDQFNSVIETAVEYYPEDETANLNAAIAAIQAGEYEKAEALLSKAGDSPEASNARGIIASNKGEIDEAIQYFEKAGNLPEAVKNKGMLE